MTILTYKSYDNKQWATVSHYFKIAYFQQDI